VEKSQRKEQFFCELFFLLWQKKVEMKNEFLIKISSLNNLFLLELESCVFFKEIVYQLAVIDEHLFHISIPFQLL